MKKDVIVGLIGIFIVIIFFVATSYIVQNNLDEIKNFIGKSIFSVGVYIFALIVAVVVAPLNAAPLVPIASSVWGWQLTSALTVIGWTTGSAIAFGLARKFGVPLVEKFVPLEKIGKYEKMIPTHNIFWGIVFLRMSIPADVLSYVLGLFSKIRFWQYVLATLIGFTPFALGIAYIGALPVYFQILAVIISGLVFLLVYFIWKHNHRKHKEIEARKKKRR